MPAIGDQAERVLLEHLLSKDKHEPLNWVKDRINWDYQDSKGQVLTRKKVQNRLDYLKQLDQGQFVELCLRYNLNVDWANFLGDIEGQFSDEEEQVPTPTPAPAPAPAPAPSKPATKPKLSPTGAKRDFAEMTVENPTKRVKFDHHDVPTLLGVNKDDIEVYPYEEGKMVYGEGFAIEQGTNEIPGLTLQGKKTRNSGFVIFAMIQTSEIFQDEEIEIGAHVENNRYLVMKSRHPFAIFLDTQRFTTALPNEKSHIVKILEEGQHEFNARNMGARYIVVDFGSIPISASAITGIDSDEVEMTLVPYQNTVPQIAKSSFLNPIEHWVIWEIARTDVKATRNEPLQKKTKQTKKSKAAKMLLGKSGMKKAPTSSHPLGRGTGRSKKPPPAGGDPNLNPDIPAPKKKPKIPEAPYPPLPPNLNRVAGSSFNPISPLRNQAEDDASQQDSIQQIMNGGDDDSTAKVLGTCDSIEKEFEQVNSEHQHLVGDGNGQEVEVLIEKCDRSHAKSMETLANTHEDGGDGDFPMGGDRNHLKRDRSLSPKRSRIAGVLNRIRGSQQ